LRTNGGTGWLGLATTDQWMSEGFFELSASLYIHLSKDLKKLMNFGMQRKLPYCFLLKPKVVSYTAGPITQGYRFK